MDVSLAVLMVTYQYRTGIVFPTGMMVKCEEQAVDGGLRGGRGGGSKRQW